MSQTLFATVTTLANAGKVRRETRNGRDVYIVPSYTLPDDIVMNGIKYPAKEIAKSYNTLDRTPAPLGHPIIDGDLVSASDPEAQNLFGIGAFNANVRQDEGRIYLEKIIDVEIANATARGRRVVNALAEGQPIHTSTGLIGTLTNEGDQKVIRDI